MTSGERVQLGYAARVYRPWTWRKRTLGYFAALLLLVLTYATWSWRKAAWAQANLLYHQQQCLAYAPSPDQIVFSTDPAIVGQPGYSVMWGTSPYANMFDQNTAVFRPAIYNLFLADSTQPSGKAPLLFLGSLRNPQGQQRLVAVAGYQSIPLPPPSRPQRRHFFYTSEVVRPAGIFNAPVNFRGKYQTGVSFDLTEGSLSPITVYAGRANPNHPSEFSIRVQVLGQPERFIDGELNSADQIQLRWRPTKVGN